MNIIVNKVFFCYQRSHFFLKFDFTAYNSCKSLGLKFNLKKIISEKKKVSDSDGAKHLFMQHFPQHY